MTYFDFEIDEKDIASAKFIGDTRRGLVKALLDAKKDNPEICQAYVARKTGMDKSTVSKILNGSGNLTLRTIAEICWAIGIDPLVSFPFLCDENQKSNHHGTVTSGRRASYMMHWGDSQPSTAQIKVKTIKADPAEVVHAT